jgi:hypothetical protein
VGDRRDGFGGGELRERDLDVDGWIILKWIVKKWDGDTLAGLTWLS